MTTGIDRPTSGGDVVTVRPTAPTDTAAVPHDVSDTHGGTAPARDVAVELAGVSAGFGGRVVIDDVSMAVRRHAVTALIGPSGSGKSTLLRCINRMHEVVPGAGLEGQVLVDGVDVYGAGVDPVDVRRRVGMVFQRPNPFPTMSIWRNVAAGVLLNGIRTKGAELEELVTTSLEGAGLWNEVKDRLNDPASALSGGQQQRLCIARAIALQPAVLLMDEPASALDPQSTARVEQLVLELKERYTIVIVTHNMQQAARVADDTAFLTVPEEGAAARLVEFAPTRVVFGGGAEHQLTRDYVGGRFG